MVCEHLAELYFLLFFFIEIDKAALFAIGINSRSVDKHSSNTNN